MNTKAVSTLSRSTVILSGEMMTRSDVVCPVPPTPVKVLGRSHRPWWRNLNDTWPAHRFMLSLSNDGKIFSRQTELTVYDSKCMSCEIGGPCNRKVCYSVCLRQLLQDKKSLIVPIKTPRVATLRLKGSTVGLLICRL